MRYFSGGSLGNWDRKCKKKNYVNNRDSFTVLRELGGTEVAGDPERLLVSFQRQTVGRKVGFGVRQLQVAQTVRQAGVLLTLETQNSKTDE